MGESIIKNSLYNIINRGYNVLYPLITSAYISRIFYADGVGEIMFAINIVTYFALAASLGIPNYAVKILASNRNDKLSLNKRFSELAIILFISSIFTTLLYFFSIPFIFEDSRCNYEMAYVLGLIILSNAFNYDWLFEAVEDYKYLAIRSIVIKTIALIALFIMVKQRSDVILYCAIYASISVSNNIWNFFSAKKYATYIFSNLEVKQHLTPILTLFGAAFATEVYTLLDSTMLGVLCPPEYLGYYSNASKVVRATFGLVFASIAVFNPRLNNLYKRADKSDYKNLFQFFYSVGLYIAIPATILLFVLSSDITTLAFGASFANGSFTLRLLSILIIVFTMASMFGHIGLIIYNKEKTLLYATIVGAVTNFSLNSFLIPHYYHNGAAIASIISEVLVTFILISASLKHFRINMLNVDFFKTLLSAFALLVLLYLVTILFETPLWRIALSLIITPIYVLVSILLKHDVPIRLKYNVRSFLTNQ